MAFNYYITVQQVVDAVYRKLGVNVQGDTVTDAGEQAAALVAFNAMLGRFFTRGLPVWREIQYIAPFVAGQSSYTLSASELNSIGGLYNVYQAYRKNISTGIEIPLRVVSRDEYHNMTNKSQTGAPVMIAVAPAANQYWIYLTPDTTTASSEQLVVYGYQPLETYSSFSTQLVFPPEWYEALIYGLAVRLAPEYGIPLEAKRDLEKSAAEALADAELWNPEATPLYFGASTYGRS